MANREFNGDQRAVDAMADGRDPNEDRKKKGTEYGMGAGSGGSGSNTQSGGERAMESMNKGIDSAKGWIGKLFSQSETQHHDKSPGSTRVK